LVVRLEDSGDLEEAKSAIVSIADTTTYEVMTWREIMPELVQAIQADNAGGLIMIMILYVVVTFGIFGTMLMMMNERRFEFGVLLSVGMSRLRLISMTLIELALLAILGGFAGALVVYPLQIYFNRNPIQFSGQSAAAIEQYGWEAVMPASVDPWITLTHTTGVLIVTLAISLYAVFKLVRLKPVEAMRL
jgi:ABC-type lipoprotein release transport system permease subunit